LRNNLNFPVKAEEIKKNNDVLEGSKKDEGIVKRVIEKIGNAFKYLKLKFLSLFGRG
jgi:hypothetical protein